MTGAAAGPAFAVEGPTDLPTVQGLLGEAADFLSAKGVHQWHRAWFEEARQVRWLEAALAEGQVTMARVGEDPAGAFVLLREAGPFDRRLWGDAPADAAYLHRVVVARRYAGRGFGSRLVAEAERLASAERRRRLRLDCAADNGWLNAFYARLGYAEVRVAAADGWRCRLREKPLAP